jgi:hypothetical protein
MDQWRVQVNTILNLRVLLNIGKFLSSCTTGAFSKSAQLHGVSYKVHRLSEPGYVTPHVGNITEEKSHVCVSLSPGIAEK